MLLKHVHVYYNSHRDGKAWGKGHGHGKVMECTGKMTKVDQNVVIIHGVLLFLSLNFAIFMLFLCLVTKACRFYFL